MAEEKSRRALLREFLEQESVGAARSKEAKRAKRKKRMQRFSDWIAEKAEKIEANGNPAAAEQYRAFWRRVSRREAVSHPEQPESGQ